MAKGKSANATPAVPAAKLRRLALAHQGLTQANPFGRGKAGVQNAIERLGYVQIDTISVVARAHHHVLRSRVANYEPKLLDRLIDERKVFEYWYHAAAYLPMSEYRYALPRMATYKSGEAKWMRSRDTRLMADVLDRVRDEGPMMARQFERPGGKAAQGWWDWKPAKRALEQLFMQGDLMIAARDGFQKRYDLSERVLPDWVDTSMPTNDEFARHLVDGVLRAHGFSTMKGFTYLRPGAEVRQHAKAYVEQRIDAGTLTAIRLPSGEVGYADPELLESAGPRTRAVVSLLSPFDNSVIQRSRGIAVFDFDYQIECYVTESKRQYGYFCLPILFRDQFVGRADCKAHRKTGRFEVKALYMDAPLPDPALTSALADALWQFADFNGCDSITLGAVSPATFKRPLTAAIDTVRNH